MRIKHLIRFLIVLLTTLAALTPLATRATPTVGTWTMTGAMHQARGFQAATLLSSGLVLVAGGCGTCSGTNPDPNLTSAELYHPHTGTWTVTGAMRQARARQAAALLSDGRVLVAGGAADGAQRASGNSLTAAEIYNPRTGTWTVTDSLHDPRGYQTGERRPCSLTARCWSPAMPSTPPAISSPARNCITRASVPGR